MNVFVHLSLRWSIPDGLISGQEKETYVIALGKHLSHREDRVDMVIPERITGLKLFSLPLFPPGNSYRIEFNKEIGRRPMSVWVEC